MYLEKRKTVHGLKYYLSHSFREGGKVKKTRVYIGVNLKKKMLDERVDKAKSLLMQQLNSFKIIRSPINYRFTKRELEGRIFFLKRHDNGHCCYDYPN